MFPENSQIISQKGAVFQGGCRTYGTTPPFAILFAGKAFDHKHGIILEELYDILELRMFSFQISEDRQDRKVGFIAIEVLRCKSYGVTHFLEQADRSNLLFQLRIELISCSDTTISIGFRFICHKKYLCILKYEFCAAVTQIDQFTTHRADLSVTVFVVVSPSEDTTASTTSCSPVIFLVSISNSGSFCRAAVHCGAGTALRGRDVFRTHRTDRSQTGFMILTHDD